MPQNKWANCTLFYSCFGLSHLHVNIVMVYEHQKLIDIICASRLHTKSMQRRKLDDATATNVRYSPQLHLPHKLRDFNSSRKFAWSFVSQANKWRAYWHVFYYYLLVLFVCFYSRQWCEKHPSSKLEWVNILFASGVYTPLHNLWERFVLPYGQSQILTPFIAIKQSG